MAQVSYTPLSPGAPENVNSLNTILAALAAGVNSVDSTQLASSSVATASIQSGAVTYAKLATDSTNAFLKLTTAADKKVAFGTGSITCSSGGGVGAIAYGSSNVTHGMGLTPSYVFLTVITGGSLAGGNVMLTLTANSIGGTTFTANASAYTPGADNVNGTVSFAWVAIG